MKNINVASRSPDKNINTVAQSGDTDRLLKIKKNEDEIRLPIQSNINKNEKIIAPTLAKSELVPNDTDFTKISPKTQSKLEPTKEINTNLQGKTEKNQKVPDKNILPGDPKLKIPETKDKKDAANAKSSDSNHQVPSSDTSKSTKDKFDEPPASIENARLHAMAKRISKRPALKNPQTICKCCGLSWENQQFSICANSRELEVLGPGYPLYYSYVKFLIFNLAVIGLISGAYSLVRNLVGDVCQPFTNTNGFKCESEADPDCYQCLPSFIYKSSVANYQNGTDWIEKLLNLISFLFLVAFQVFYRGRMKVMVKEIDVNQITPSDYTLMFENIPINESEASIKEYFESNGLKGERIIVNRVALAYKIGDYVNWLQKKQLLLNTQNKLKNKPSASNELEKNNLQLAELEKLCKEFEEALKINLSSKFTGICFVSCNTQAEAKKLLKRWKLSGFEKILYKILPCLKKYGPNYRGTILNCQRAPEPNDVYWENLGYTYAEKLQKKLIANLLSLVLLIIVFFVCLGLSYFQFYLLKSSKPSNETSTDDSASNTDNSESKTMFIQFLSFCMSMLILNLNTIFRAILRKFAIFEKNPTYTSYNNSVAKKLTAAQFINTAIITFGTNLLVQPLLFYIWGSGGLIYDAFSMIALNVILAPLLNWANLVYFINKVLKRQNVIKNVNNYSQRQANEIFEGPPVDIAQRYANILKTLLLVGFYFTIFPFGLVFGIISLFFQYWMDKYLLLRRHSFQASLSANLGNEMIDLLDMFLLVFGLGDFVFSAILRRPSIIVEGETIDYSISIFTWILFVLSILNVIVPTNRIFLIMGLGKKKKENKIQDVSQISSASGQSDKKNSHSRKTKHMTYDQVRFQFYTEYERINPVTRTAKNLEFIKWLKSRKVFGCDRKTAGR